MSQEKQSEPSNVVEPETTEIKESQEEDDNNNIKDLNNYRTIEITNLSDGLQEKHLEEIFCGCGEIEIFTVKLRFGSGRVCYIRYKDYDSAEDALILQNQDLDNKKLNIKIVHNSVLNNFIDNKNDEQIKKEIRQQTLLQELQDKKSEEIKKAIKEVLEAGKPRADIDMNEEENERQAKLARTIYVGNLNPLIQQDHITEFFSVCGKVNLVKIAGNNTMTQGIRYGFVEFDNIDSARQAYKLSGHMLLDKPIKIGPAKNAIISPTLKSTSIMNNTIKLSNAMTKVRMVADQINQRYVDKKKKNDKLKKEKSSKKHRDKDRDRDKVSRDKDRDRDRDRHDRKRKKKRKRSRSRSRDRDRHRHRHSSRHRDRDRDRRKRRHRHHTRSRSRSRHRNRHSSRDRHRSKRDKSRESKEIPKNEKKKYKVNINSIKDIKHKMKIDGLSDNDDQPVEKIVPIDVLSAPHIELPTKLNPTIITNQSKYGGLSSNVDTKVIQGITSVISQNKHRIDDNDISLKSKFLSHNGTSFSGLGGEHELGVTTTIGAPGYGNTHDRPAAPHTGMIWDGFQWHPAPNKKEAFHYRKSKFPPHLLQQMKQNSTIDMLQNLKHKSKLNNEDINILQTAALNLNGGKLNTKYPPNPMNAMPLVDDTIALAAAVAAKANGGQLITPQQQTILKLANVNNTIMENQSRIQQQSNLFHSNMMAMTGMTGIHGMTGIRNNNNNNMNQHNTNMINNNDTEALAHIAASNAVEEKLKQFYNR